MFMPMPTREEKWVWIDVGHPYLIISTDCAIGLVDTCYRWLATFEPSISQLPIP